LLRLVLPKGSLEKSTFDLFSSADLAITRSSAVDYICSINDPRIAEVRILRPQEIPGYVKEGLFDFGITGRDWIEETNSEVVSLGELNYSKATSNPIRVVLAVGGDSSFASAKDIPDGSRISTEYPQLTDRFFKRIGKTMDIRLSYGATEAKIPHIADAIVEITETGRAIKAAGLKIIDELLVSRTELIANKHSAADDIKFHAMEQIYTLLVGSLEARDKVLVKLNVESTKLQGVLGKLPSLRSPTISQLSTGDAYAVEVVALKSQINTLIPELKDAGASDILELPISKIVH
jgi:ATP phosphoribosyltransferase